MGAAIAAAVIAAGGAVYGANQNSKAAKANAGAQQESQHDYKERLKKAGVWAAKLEKQYNELVKERPNLEWPTYVKEQIQKIDDPSVRNFYLNAKQQDFDNLRSFAQRATSDNVDNLLSAADEISGGKWQENLQKSYELIDSTDASLRMMRANELSAPLLSDDSTVRYNDKGELIRGQRADKQVYNTAYETQAATEREQLANRRNFQSDILSAAQSQTEKAKDFTSFFDSSGFATSLAQQQSAQENSYQLLNEQRGWSLFQQYAAASSGITPTQPAYQNANPGDALISSSLTAGAGALTDYYKTQQKQKADAAKTTPAPTANAYTSP